MAIDSETRITTFSLPPHPSLLTPPSSPLSTRPSPLAPLFYGLSMFWIECGSIQRFPCRELAPSSFETRRAWSRDSSIPGGSKSRTPAGFVHLARNTREFCQRLWVFRFGNGFPIVQAGDFRLPGYDFLQTPVAFGRQRSQEVTTPRKIRVRSSSVLPRHSLGDTAVPFESVSGRVPVPLPTGRVVIAGPRSIQSAGGLFPEIRSDRNTAGA